MEKQSETKIEPDGTLVLLEEDHQIIDEIIRTAEKLNTKILFIATPYIATNYRCLLYTSRQVQKILKI